MPKLVIDIEAVGEDFDTMDPTTQEELTKRVPEGDKDALEEVKNSTGLSPLTGEIVAIGILDVEKEKGVVYFQAPDEKIEEFEEGGVVYKQMDEKAMLESFWGGVDSYDEFITFNGRGFDIPYMIARSAVHKVRITKDLMSHRYLNSQQYGAKHVDLYDQLGFYGAWRPRGLHLWTRALGITSPKQGGLSGADVGDYYKKKKFVDIAKYNGRDLFATRELYLYWKEFMQVD